jgi:TonB-dependent starch-binding outer membrane protein SusC
MSKYTFYGICLQIVVSGVLLAHASNAQQERLKDVYLSINIDNLKLTDALHKIGRQTSFNFAYNDVRIDENRRVSIKARNQSLESLLQNLAREYNLNFKRINENIFVSGVEIRKGLMPEVVEPELQSLVITGKVTSSEEPGGLPGVNITVKGTTTGTITDIQGEYRLEVPSGDLILIYSSVGYLSEEVQINNRSVINIALTTDVTQLEEIVVVGYGAVKKSDLTGSVSSVSEEQIRTMVTTSVDQALQGRAAGVQVTTNSGQPGGGISVRIRGANSVSGGNEPLYVVDGVPISGNSAGTAVGFDWAGGGNGQTAVSALSTINPNDIASIEILKDASATAIYGSRAANGVVLITTKRGKAGESKLNYDAFVGVQQPSRFLKTMELPSYAEYQTERAREMDFNIREEFLDPSLLGPGTNWQREIFQSAIVHSHQLSLSGGSEHTQFSISGGYFKQDGVVVGSGFDRFSLRLNVDNQAKKWLKVGNSIMFSRTNERITLNDSDDGVVSTAIVQAPDIPVRNIDGSFAGPTLEGSSTGITNPVAMALERDMRLVRNRVLSNLYGEVKLAKNLTFRSEIGVDAGFNNNYGFNPTYEWGTVVNTRANSRRNASLNLFYIFQNYVTYNKRFNDRHNFTFMGGHEVQESRWEGLMGGRQDFVSNDIQELNAGDPTTAVNSQNKGSSTLQSYFGRLNYGFDERYLLTFTLRADGSSKFGPQNKWGVFPSAAFAWRAINEEFLKGQNTVSDLKLRLGWGQVGNEAIPGYGYGSAMAARGTPMGTGFVISNMPNPAVQWESQEQWNVGVDLGLFTNRVNLTVDLYKKFVNDLLLRLPMPSYMGGGSWMGIQEPWVNAGKVENKGIEAMLTTVNSTGDFEWSTDFIFTLNRNEVKFIGGESGVIFNNVQWFHTVSRTAEGYPMGMFYGFRTDGVFRDLEHIESSPTQNDRVDLVSGVYPGDLKFKDLNDDGIIDDNDREVIGDPNPMFVFGFNNSFRYKNFDLTVTTNGSYGNKIFNFARRSWEGMRNMFANQLETVNDRARLGLIDPNGSIEDPANVFVLNPNTNMPRAIHTDPNNNTRISDRYVEDGSYLRIQNIILGYNLPGEITRRMGVGNFRVYANIQNLFTFTKYTGFDPEIGAFNQNPLLQGVDNGRYPLPRMFTLGVNVDF